MSKNLHLLSSYQFNFDESLIAQYPVTPRDSSRLMVVDRATGSIDEVPFHAIQRFLSAGDSLVFNNTKVIPARLNGRRAGGGFAEILLHKPCADGTWEALARPGRKLGVGSIVSFGEDFSCKVLDCLPDGTRRIQFFYEGSFEEKLEIYGTMPLPHYIKRSSENTFDGERYQTIYAEVPGAVAAPTAGLHFTRSLLDELKAKGVTQTEVTLHVGLGTFKPVKVEDVRTHSMHSERCIVSAEAAAILNNRDLESRHLCIGTTCCRVLESAADNDGIIGTGAFETDIFIYPGYKFKHVRALLTNFHLPGSTLLMLVSAFAGYDLMMEAYAKAVKEKYRFFSYGDAMLIL